MNVFERIHLRIRDYRRHRQHRRIIKSQEYMLDHDATHAYFERRIEELTSEADTAGDIDGRLGEKLTSLTDTINYQHALDLRAKRHLLSNHYHVIESRHVEWKKTKLKVDALFRKYR